MTGEAPSIEVELSDEFAITLAQIEFPAGAEEFDQDGNRRAVCLYRLHFGEGWVTLPVTMTEPYSGLDDLRQQADTQLYIILRQLAEWARKRADAQEMSFVSHG